MFIEAFLFCLYTKTYKKVENKVLFLFANIKNNSIFATALRAKLSQNSWGDTQAANEDGL